MALFHFRQSSGQTQPALFRDYQASSSLPVTNVLPYIAWLLPHLHRWSRSFHARQQAEDLRNTLRSYAQGHRRSNYLHADDIYPLYLRRYGHFFDVACPATIPVLSSHIKFCAVPVSNHPAHPAGHAHV